MYITPVQLAESPGARELAQVATPEQSPVVDTALMDATLRGTDRSAWSSDDIAVADDALARIQDAIDGAGAVIEGYLVLRGYALPLDPAPNIVTRWARSIVRYSLHKDRISDPKSDPIARDYSDALKFLQATADGSFSIGVSVDPAAPAGSAGEVSTSAPCRVFTGCNLDDFIDPNGSASC